MVYNAVSNHLTTIHNLDGDPISRLIFQERCIYPGVPYEKFSWEVYVQKLYGEGQQLPEPLLSRNIMVVLRPDLFPNHIKTFATKHQLLVGKHSEFLPYPTAIAIEFFHVMTDALKLGSVKRLKRLLAIHVLNHQRLQWGVVEKFGCGRSISFALLLYRPLLYKDIVFLL